MPLGSVREVRLSLPKFPGTCIPASGLFSGTALIVIYTNPKYAYPRLGPVLGDGLRKAPLCLLLLFRPREVRVALPKFAGTVGGRFARKVAHFGPEKKYAYPRLSSQNAFFFVSPMRPRTPRNHKYHKMEICMFCLDTFRKVLHAEVEEASSSLTAEQWTAMWGKTSTSFLGEQATRRSHGVMDEPQRRATLDWMEDMNHGLKPLGWSFGRCQSKCEDQQDTHKQDKTRQTRAPIMVLCTDQEATQLAAVAYLRNKKGLWVEHVSDPAHRSHNDVCLSTTQVRSMVHFVVQHQVRTLAEGNLVEEDPADCPTHEGQHVAVRPHFAHVLPRHIDGRRHVAGPEHGGHTEDMVAKLARHGLHLHEGHEGQQESLQLANDSSQCIGQRVVGPRLGSHGAVRGQQMDKHRRGPLLAGQQHGSCIANTQWKQDVGSEGGKGQHEPSTPEQHKQFTHDDEVHACAGEQVDRQDDIPRLTTRAASVFEDAPGAALQ